MSVWKSERIERVARENNVQSTMYNGKRRAYRTGSKRKQCTKENKEGKGIKYKEERMERVERLERVARRYKGKKKKEKKKIKSEVCRGGVVLEVRLRRNPPTKAKQYKVQSTMNKVQRKIVRKRLERIGRDTIQG